MSIIKRFSFVPVWLAGLTFLFAAVNKNDPYLIALRGPGNIAIAVASVVAVIVLIRRGDWRRRLHRKITRPAVVPAAAGDAVGACLV